MNSESNLCMLCPRECGVDRAGGRRGICGQTDELKVARAALHMWEEPCISGTRGSGTVFFSGCALGCVYCQNKAISSGGVGKIITVARLAEIFLELQAKGAHNINLVTPDHFAPQIAEAIRTAKAAGLGLPLVYNSSCYVKTATLRALEGLIDIFLPDIKYMDEKLSLKYSGCGDYFTHAANALEEMVRQAGDPSFDDDGLMRRGVIVRHLALPGCIEDSKRIIKYLYEAYGDGIYISILNQYTPMAPLREFPELDRKLSTAEYDELVDYAISLGVENGFIQEGETASESFIPDFDAEGV